MIKLAMPFYLIWLVFDLFVLKRFAVNGIKTAEAVKKLNTYKHLRFIPDISTELVKKRAKELSTPQMKLTINDIIMTVMSKSLHDYLREKTDDKTTKEIFIACPFSLRPKPEFLGDFMYNNDFSIIPVRLRLVDNVNEGIKTISSDMQGVKNSLMPFGYAYLVGISM